MQINFMPLSKKNPFAPLGEAQVFCVLCCRVLKRSDKRMHEQENSHQVAWLRPFTLGREQKALREYGKAKDAVLKTNPDRETALRCRFVRVTFRLVLTVNSRAFSRHFQH
jgi:hypothetical protein